MQLGRKLTYFSEDDDSAECSISSSEFEKVKVSFHIAIFLPRLSRSKNKPNRSTLANESGGIVSKASMSFDILKC